MPDYTWRSAEAYDYSTLGRHTDPTEEEILAAENGLCQAGLSGWLAVAEGDFHGRHTAPRLMEVRRIGAGEVRFEGAAAAFTRLLAQV